MYRLLPARLWIFLIWGGLIAVSLSTRPLFPIDETRYAAVAWEMWVREDFLVPYLNGEPYSHKPPLLFWLMQAGWRLFGVNDWSLRLIAPLFSLATLFLSSAVARALWPERKRVEELTPLILLGVFIWIVYSTLTMFDMMLAFFVLLGIYSLVKLASSGVAFRHWALLGVAIGGGVLSKGPVILLHLLPVALLAPWWRGRQAANFRWRQWYAGLVSAVLIGSVIALSWAIPAGMAGGEVYRQAIFLGQTSGRLVKSFAHQLPWWWYLEILPLLLLPWLLFKPIWSGLVKLNVQEPGIRFCLAWLLPVFIAFSLVSGKRIHYLLPLMPALALLLARSVDEASAPDGWKRAHIIGVLVFSLLGIVLALLPGLNNYYHWRTELSVLSPVWGSVLLVVSLAFAAIRANTAQDSVLAVCLTSVTAFIVLSCGFFEIEAERYDTKNPGRKIAALMNKNRDISYYGNKYYGQYHFMGRLGRPIAVLSNFDELYNWAGHHKTGYIIVTYKDAQPLPASVISYHYPYKSQNIALLPSRILLENPALRSVISSQN
ncbi:Dolichyl-phosphate-mannose-protein mannosyltransferase [Candidatus Methylobacter favarea]|uniref:Dolichyl-phosphate-mannose-protein mannosyltransferase n=1 Tax=Candidatus Methylobacter favarea TaxID=2707345 RepID=A0A8S0Y5K4_9GAMM|nr:glycosyltransferase family 39 protein [Candidatus Methylobacter favarea]CAA9889278.1 Dolichyl-phosphate-mannose-protein mannosyltransferase [Candidatus Methylobacter favarea]